MAQYSLGIREYGTDGKKSSATVYCDDLTAVTFTAQMGFAAALRAAILAVQLGEDREAVYGHVQDPGGTVLPSNPNAQREAKWLVSCRETAAGMNAVTFTIPCADLQLLDAGGENMDTTTPEYTALVSAVEDFVRSNDLGAVVVESIKYRSY